MRATLGIDIGTFESKGVIVDSAGNIIAQAAVHIRCRSRARVGPNMTLCKTGGVILYI